MQVSRDYLTLLRKIKINLACAGLKLGVPQAHLLPVPTSLVCSMVLEFAV